MLKVELCNAIYLSDFIGHLVHFIFEKIGAVHGN